MGRRRHGKLGAVTERDLIYYRAHIRDAIQDDAVVCLECGRRYRDLAKHVAQSHLLHPDHYREKWGYKRTRGLICGQRRRYLEAQIRARALPDPAVALKAVRRHAGYRMRLEAREAQEEAIREGLQRFPHRKATDEELVRLAGAGLSRKAIAARFGMSYKSLWERLAKLRARGIPLEAPARPGEPPPSG